MKQGWEIKKLGEVCEIKGRIGYRGYTVNDLVEKGEGAITLSPSNIQNNQFNTEKCTYISWFKYDESPEIMVFEGDILFVKTGSTYGKVALVENLPEKATINPQFVVLKNIKCSNRFLYYALTTSEFKEKVENIIGGAATPTLSQTNLAEQTISIPPLPEQQSIVSILDEAFAAIAKAKANAEQNLKNAAALFESYLQGVFEKKGVGWEEKTIGEIGNPKMCKRIFKEQTAAVGEIPFYKIGTFGKEPDVYISKEIYDEFRAKYSYPKKGDVLISASGTIGRRVRYDGEPAYFQDSNIVWIENDEKQVSNDFLFEFYGACNWGSTKGATISRLYNDNLKSIKISFPKSHKEQQTIVQQLNVVRTETQKLEALYQKKIADLEELKKSILQKAFAGELRGGEPVETKTEKAVAL